MTLSHSTAVDTRLNALTDLALATRDGHLLSGHINTIAAYEGDPHARGAALVRIADKNPFASYIVVGVLSGLALHNLPQAREFARKLINAPFDPEKDIILARAYGMLLELPPIALDDIPLIVKGLSHPVGCIRDACDRSLKSISLSSLNFIHEELQKRPLSEVVRGILVRIEPLRVLMVNRLPRPEIIEMGEEDSPKTRKVRIPEQKVRSVRESKVAEKAQDNMPVREVGGKQSTEQFGSTVSTPVVHKPLELQRLPESDRFSNEDLHKICETTDDPEQFILAMGSLFDRIGRSAALVHADKFLFFTCLPEYPRDLFQQMSGPLFRS